MATSALSGAGNLNNGNTLLAGPSLTGGNQASTSTDLSVPSLGSLTPQTPATATYGSSPSTADKASADQVGLLSQAASQNATGAKVDPLADISSGSMDAKDSTNAASQLDAITSQNSPYIQLAEQQGLLTAASRGLENSSLGAGAAQAAATAAAAPLAQQNASEASQGKLQTSAQEQAAGLQNAQLGTQASEFNASQDAAAKELQAQLGTSVNQSNAQLQTANNQFNAQEKQSSDAANAAATNSMASQTAALTEDMNKQDLSGTQAARLASIQAQSAQLIASNQSAASLYSSYLSSMSATMANQNISPARAADSLTAMQNMVQSGLSVIDGLNGMSLNVTMPSTTASGGGFVTAPGATSAPTPSAPAPVASGPATTKTGTQMPAMELPGGGINPAYQNWLAKNGYNPLVAL